MIARRDFDVRTVDDIRITIREVRHEDPSVANSRIPMVLVHGTRIPGLSEYDLDVPGGSLAADLASAGHVCYIIDMRGFGRSQRPPEMEEPPTGTRSLYRSTELTRDIDAAVDHLRLATGRTQVGLFGWGAGGLVCLMHAALWPEKVSHLVLYNMIYGGSDQHAKYKLGSKWDTPGKPGRFNHAAFGNYAFNDVDFLGVEWNAQIPIEDKDAWRDPAIVKAFRQALIDGDPTARDRNPPTYRSPNGMLEDLFNMGLGRKLIHAGQVYSRVMIVKAEYDVLCRTEDMAALAADLVNAPEVRNYAPSNTTHYILFDRPERGRDALLREMDDFLTV